MRALGVSVLGVLLVLGCSPTAPGRQIKTANDLLEQEDAAAREDEAARRANLQTRSEAESGEVREQIPFDHRHADIELTRAARNAAQCPSVVTEDVTATKVAVRLTFNNEGKVPKAGKDESGNEVADGALLSGVAADTALGKCVLNAMRAVQVQKFTGPSVVIDWPIEFVAKSSDASTTSPAKAPKPAK